MTSRRDFLSPGDLEPDELQSLLDDAARVKKDPSGWRDRLSARQVALVFEKPSTRTRVSFEAAITAMSGNAIVLRGDELQLVRGETIEDTARVLSRYVDALVVRTFGQDTLERLAAAAAVPVINALTDMWHPCQMLADLLTIYEKKGRLRDTVLAYIGDGNNVAHSLMVGGVQTGMQVRICCPPALGPLPQVVERSNEIARDTNGSVLVTSDIEDAAREADVLYTDVWTSMGQEDEADDRRQTLVGYQINRSVVSLSKADAIVMHCLPAHRGEEISAEVFEGPRSVVWDQAENRLHTQKALLGWLLA